MSTHRRLQNTYASVYVYIYMCVYTCASCTCLQYLHIYIIYICTEKDRQIDGGIEILVEVSGMDADIDIHAQI